MEIPINDTELKKIIELLKNSREQQLYAKLWSYKINNLSKENKK
jgi:hypothetical protein